MINAIPRNREQEIASKFPKVKSLEKSNWFATIMKAPKIATDNPKIIVGLCLRLKKYFSIKKVKMGARVPKKVAFAIVVSLSDPKNNAKWIPNKKPPNSVLFLLIAVSGSCFLKKLIIHRMSAPNAILQNEIATAGTFSK